ncbi:putative leucine-rich repeat receptor-like protein kinase-like [Dorcoceras hygrometricum]|uniref:Putative leucine-rich repeat receptor-like protein kinase-like n=1 Tax=Dorcoceras hygrometricum TaxID=472368 RepID=A0A2Z7BA74_9LAMI|nr:putative leucine-rich repeat receptor-like protein kinase-like [Dorcoceras hygrometricum]
MVQVRQLENEQKHVLINVCGGLWAIEYRMAGRGGTRRSSPLEETDSDNNANITQLLRLLVEQNNRGNGQSSSSRGPSNDDPQEKFRRQKPKEFSVTPIRSTTRSETPSSGCTRSPDEISTNGFSTSSWPETNFPAKTAAAAAAACEREGGGGLLLGLGL